MSAPHHQLTQGLSTRGASVLRHSIEMAMLNETPQFSLVSGSFSGRTGETTLYPLGNWKRLGSGSAVEISVARNVCLPRRGSVRIERRLIPNCGEYQVSCSTVMGASLPNTPGL